MSFHMIRIGTVGGQPPALPMGFEEELGRFGAEIIKASSKASVPSVWADNSWGVRFDPKRFGEVSEFLETHGFPVRQVLDPFMRPLEMTSPPSIGAASVFPAVPPADSSQPPVRIEDISSEAELMQLLLGGRKIIAYYGSDRERSPGDILDRPFGGTPEEQRALLLKDTPARLIEEVRKREFPNFPSRVDSIFIAPSASEASCWGTVYEVELSLKPGEKPSSSILRWVDRKKYEDFTRWSHTGMIEGPQWEMDESALDDLRLYFTSKGSHTVSEILVDPRFVEIRVVRPYAISLKDFIDKIFANDPMVGRPPAHVNDVLERVKSWVPGHLLNEYGSEAIKKTAVKRFIEIELDSVLAEAGDYHPFDVSIDGQKMTHIKLWLIRCALEAANPYEGVDPEYKILVKRMKELESDITSRGHLIYLGYLAESGRGSSGAKNFDRWEKRYREACVIAGVSPNEEAVIKARSQIGAK